MSDDTPRCPECQSSDFTLEVTGAPGAYWCEDCQREFWQEGGDWFSCGIDDLEPRPVSAGGDQP